MTGKENYLFELLKIQRMTKIKTPQPGPHGLFSFLNLTSIARHTVFPVNTSH